MTEKQLWSLYKEELACTMGSTQMIKFGFGLKFAIEGFDIPDELYPLPTSKYLAEQYKPYKNLEMWNIILWGSTAMVELHRQSMDAFGVKFDKWFSEKSLHHGMESLASACFVTNGVVMNTTDGTRCTQCGKKMKENMICKPCYHNWGIVDINEWADYKGLPIDATSIWDNFTNE